MAKILISLLGTGKYAKGDDTNNRYVTTNYILNGNLYKDQTLTSIPIIKEFHIDRVYFIGTKESMWDNVADIYGADENYIMEVLEKKEEKLLKEEDLKKLSSFIDKKLNGNNSRCIIVESGESDEELWNIFYKFLDILNEIEDEDTVYFDITHLFRSQSVMSFVISEFGRTYKNFKIGGMFYGMLKKNEPSKIINVGMFFELLEWAKAIEEMEKFASFKRVVKLSENKIEKNGFNSLKKMQEAFDIANMSEVYNAVKNISKHIKYFDENENKIINLLSPRIKKFIKELDKNSLSEFQLSLAEFFAKRNNHALAYVALAEGIISRICEKMGLDEHNKDDREEAKENFYNYLDYPSQTSQRKFRDMYFKQINRIRNNICHQLENKKQSSHDIENFEKYLQKSKDYLKELF